MMDIATFYCDKTARPILIDRHLSWHNLQGEKLDELKESVGKVCD